MFGFATLSGVLSLELGAVLILVIALTMVLTPFVVKTMNWFLENFYILSPQQEDMTSVNFMRRARNILF